MNCNETREILSSYIDNMLKENEMEQVKAHLSICVECNNYYEELLNISNLLSSVEQETLPEEFNLEFSKAFQKQKSFHKNKRIRKFIIKSSSIAAVIVLGLFSINMYNEMDYFNKDNLIEDNGAPIQENTVMLMKGVSEDEKASAPSDMDYQNYLNIISEIYIDEQYVISDWYVDEDGNYVITVELETTNNGEIMSEVIVYMGRDGKIWKRE